MYLPHAVVLVAWVVGWVLFFRLPRLPARASVSAAVETPVTIVIPARDEADRLPALLADLDRDRPPGARVVVVDDESADGTRERAERFAFVEVRSVPPRPAGWGGKSWACHVGAQEARDGTLVFLDADVRLAPGGLARVLAAHERRGGLTSVWPYHAVRRPFEHLSALFNVLPWLACGAGSLVPARQIASAFGPLIVTHAAEYAATGGHTAVRGEVVEDLALGRAYAAAGLPVQVYGGDPEVSFRMYGDGLSVLVAGWTKNQATGALHFPRWRVVGIAFWLVASLGLLTWARGIPTTPAWALYGAYALQMGVFMRRVGAFSWLDGLLYPVHVCVYALVFAASLGLTLLRRRLWWRGRWLRVTGPGQGIGRVS